MNKLIYAVSPLKGKDGDYPKNRAYALEIARHIFDRGDIPIMPHIYFPQFMDDLNQEEREKAMNMGKKLLELADEVEVYTRYEISKGMRAEIEIAEKLMKPIKYIHYLPDEI